MSTKIRNKLIALGPEKLADSLLEMASHYDKADEFVERLVATPKEKVKRFKSKLTGLKRARRFIDWREIGGFARELSALLDGLAESVEDGKTGVELVARFFECDRAVFERCDGKQRGRVYTLHNIYKMIIYLSLNKNRDGFIFRRNQKIKQELFARLVKKLGDPSGTGTPAGRP